METLINVLVGLFLVAAAVLLVAWAHDDRFCRKSRREWWD